MISFVRGVTEGGSNKEPKVNNPDEIDIDMDVEEEEEDENEIEGLYYEE